LSKRVRSKSPSPSHNNIGSLKGTPNPNEQPMMPDFNPMFFPGMMPPMDMMMMMPGMMGMNFNMGMGYGMDMGYGNGNANPDANVNNTNGPNKANKKNR